MTADELCKVCGLPLAFGNVLCLVEGTGKPGGRPQ